jgi:hypothetical protein
MSFALQIFGKPVAKLTFKEIEQYFEEEKTESDRLEFKSYFANSRDEYIKAENTIIESISSFLNSSGGLIIWGAPKGEKRDFGDKKVKIFKGVLNPVTKEIEKDSFIRRMASLITPTPNNTVRFHPIKDINTSEPTFVYMIEVDQSPYSPHQFDGKTYKMRLDGLNHNAPHHYLEALFKKITYPNLTGAIEYQHCTDVQGQSARVMFIIEIKNLTPYQNEENLYLSVAHPRGVRHLYGHRASEGLTHNRDNDVLTHTNAKPQLFFGESFTTDLFIDYPNNTMSQTMTLIISFGGKRSPLKRTSLRFRWWRRTNLPILEMEQCSIDEFVTN